MEDPEALGRCADVALEEDDGEECSGWVFWSEDRNRIEHHTLEEFVSTRRAQDLALVPTLVVVVLVVLVLVVVTATAA